MMWFVRVRDQILAQLRRPTLTPRRCVLYSTGQEPPFGVPFQTISAAAFQAENVLRFVAELRKAAGERLRNDATQRH
jgi:hypothetical protein